MAEDMQEAYYFTRVQSIVKELHLDAEPRRDDVIQELLKMGRPELLELHMTAAATIWANALFAMNYKEEEDDGAIITPQPIDSNWTEEDEAIFKIAYPNNPNQKSNKSLL